MDRFAIFIDAGYFFAAGAQATQGRQTQRKLVTLKDPNQALVELRAEASSLVGNVPFLRTYWYDAMPGSHPSLEQTTIAMLPYVKLRLGVLNNIGEQKGVDSLIVTDLIELARNRAIADAVIVSGDEDLRIAVQVAQTLGVRVHILAAGEPKSNVSVTLQMEADSVGSLSQSWFAKHFSISAPAIPRVSPYAPSIPSVPSAASPASPVAVSSGEAASQTIPTTALSIDDAANSACKELLAAATQSVITALKQHFTTNKSVPPEFDGRLIAKTAAAIGGRKLTGDEMRHARGVFVKAVRAV